MGLIKASLLSSLLGFPHFFFSLGADGISSAHGVLYYDAIPFWDSLSQCRLSASIVVAGIQVPVYLRCTRHHERMNMNSQKQAYFTLRPHKTMSVKFKDEPQSQHGKRQSFNSPRLWLFTNDAGHQVHFLTALYHHQRHALYGRQSSQCSYQLWIHHRSERKKKTADSYAGWGCWSETCFSFPGLFINRRHESLIRKT
jgi:hypothetical protein